LCTKDNRSIVLNWFAKYGCNLKIEVIHINLSIFIINKNDITIINTKSEIISIL